MVRKPLSNNIPFLKGYQGNVCFYCGEHIDDSDIHVDHVLPRQVVRHDEIWNLVLSHSLCNLHKDDFLVSKHYLEKLILRNENIMGSNHPWKKKISETLGATDSVDPADKDYAQKMDKYDLVFECAGAAETFNTAQIIARRGGSIIVLGLTPEKTFVDFNPFQLVIKELRIVGSFLNPLTQRRAADLIDAGKLKLDPLISKVLSLDEVPAILNQPPADGDIKYIVKP
jgi:hypothetical protein